MQQHTSSNHPCRGPINGLQKLAMQAGGTGANDSDMFCSRYNGWSGEAEMNTAWGRTQVNLSAGQHTVQIKARTTNSTTYGYLAHTSLTILK